MLFKQFMRSMSLVLLAFMLAGVSLQLAIGQAIYPGPGGGGGGTPGGASGQVQSNQAGAFYGDSGLTYDKSGNLTAGSCLIASGALTLSLCGAASGGPTITASGTSPIYLKTGHGNGLEVLDAPATIADWFYFQGSQSFTGTGFVNMGTNGSDSTIDVQWNCTGACYQEFIGADGALFHVQDSGSTSTDKVTATNGSGTGASTPASLSTSVGNLQLKAPSGKGVVSTNAIQPLTTTVSALPSCVTGIKGYIAVVTDASSPTYLGTLTGSSTTTVIALCNGTNWVAG